MRVEPYVYFQGRCEEALEFYRGAIDAEGMVIARFSDIPGAPHLAEENRRRGRDIREWTFGPTSASNDDHPVGRTWSSDLGTSASGASRTWMRRGSTCRFCR